MMYETKQQVADRLHVHFKTIETYMQQGLPYYKIGPRVLFSTTEVDQWVRKHKKGANTCTCRSQK